MHPDLSATLSFLDQAKSLCLAMSQPNWVHPNAGFRDSTLGQHLRHTLEHIEALWVGLPHGKVNYDERRRDEEVETDPNAAAARCQTLRDGLAEAGERYSADHHVLSMASCSSEEAVTPHSSSFGRELQFVVSHTVHHFAIIAAICHGMGVDTPSDFGVAPSTLKHRKAIAAS